MYLFNPLIPWSYIISFTENIISSSTEYKFRGTSLGKRTSLTPVMQSSVW